MNDDYNDSNNYDNNNQYINNQYINNQQNREIPYNTVSQYYYNQNNSFENYNNISNEPTEKKHHFKIILPIIVILFITTSFLIMHFIYNNSNKKERTFMIYMVGSDLESKSKQGTFSISDIVGENIDLDNNNIILMVGGAEKWHNFVDKNEIGIYELTNDGFEKKKKMPIESMGSSATLETFLDYSYKEYPADKYDMIFWNHGLGAIGIEQDELSKDFLTINELNKAFQNSAFNNKKLELTIFYNCLASNLHIANIMKNYSEYMVASEEIFYLSKVLNRLNFLEKVKPSDTGYDIGYLFVEQSDKVVGEYNKTHAKKIDSTLSIIDLNEIDNLNSKLNDFIEKIDVKKNYYEISNYRRKAHTYGISQTYDYDTVDLYTLVESLGKISNEKDLSNSVLNEIKNTIKYTSNLNNYSNGLSIYFPYFGKDSSIETHLSLFGKVFNDSYYSFINSFYQIRSGTKKSRRSGKEGEYNKLTNNIIKNEKGELILSLTEEEKKNYQESTIYIFSKNNNKYDLLLKSDNLSLNNNNLLFSNNKLLKINTNIISYLDDGIVYGKISDENDELSVKYTINNNKINEVILDSNEYISSSIVDYNDYKDTYFSKLTYNLFENGLFNEDFKYSFERTNVKIDKENINISFVNNEEIEYYVLIEMRDIYNDSYYSNLELIK